MIKKCEKKDENLVFSYIGADYPLCLYLYLDLDKYGTDSETIDVFIQYEGEQIRSVMLKYYSCLHVYSKDTSFNADELGLFFSKSGCTILYCAAEVAQRIFHALPHAVAERATITTGWVAQIKNVDKPARGLATKAKEADFIQIVRLIYDDEDIGRSYKLEELAKQLEERNRDGYARNIVIKQKGLVIAHACTNAETSTIAVVAELLVRKEFRRQGFASEIWREICEDLLSEGKEVYSFYFTEESRKLHKHLGFFEVCEWAKVVII